jgi:hypothetical protein
MTSLDSLNEPQQNELRLLLRSAAQLITGVRQKLADEQPLSTRDFAALSAAIVDLQIAVEDYTPDAE